MCWLGKEGAVLGTGVFEGLSFRDGKSAKRWWKCELLGQSRRDWYLKKESFFVHRVIPQHCHLGGLSYITVYPFPKEKCRSSPMELPLPAGIVIPCSFPY